MKKRLINPIIILFLIIFTAYLTSAITGDTITTGAITGETITGKASNQGTNVSIQVIAVNPVLTLITPKMELI